MKMVAWRSALAGVALVCLAATAASAEAAPQGRRHQARARLAQRIEKQFTRLDQNKDGAIAKSEWTRNPRVFDRLDRNKDGVLSKDEFRRLGRRHAARRAAAARRR
jgi:Ca2+-binding EF-hand superfamily protein